MLALHTPRVRAFVSALTDITVGATSLAILATATTPTHTAVGVVLAVLLLTRAEWAR